MLRWVVFVLALMGLVSLTVACASAPTATPALPTRTRVPTLPPLVLPTATVIPPTFTTAPTLPPPTATATVVVIQPTLAISETQPTSTPTLLPTLPPLPTPTPAFPPGLYVSNLRIEPNPPVRGTDLNFFVTFSNTAGSVYNPKWLVYIYRADTPNRSYSETTALQSAISAGTIEIKSLGSWKLGLGGPCDYFFARVGFLDINNRPVMYTQPDGTVFEKGFTVCPP